MSHNSCNIGTRALPDMYALALGIVRTYQAHVTTIKYPAQYIQQFKMHNMDAINVCEAMPTQDRGSGQVMAWAIPPALLSKNT